MSAEVRPHTCTSPLLLLMIDGPQRFDLRLFPSETNSFWTSTKRNLSTWTGLCQGQARGGGTFIDDFYKASLKGFLIMHDFRRTDQIVTSASIHTLVCTAADLLSLIS